MKQAPKERISEREGQGAEVSETSRRPEGPFDRIIGNFPPAVENQILLQEKKEWETQEMWKKRFGVYEREKTREERLLINCSLERVKDEVARKYEIAPRFVPDGSIHIIKEGCWGKANPAVIPVREGKIGVGYAGRTFVNISESVARDPVRFLNVLTHELFHMQNFRMYQFVSFLSGEEKKAQISVAPYRSGLQMSTHLGGRKEAKTGKRHIYFEWLDEAVVQVLTDRVVKKILQNPPVFLQKLMDKRAAGETVSPDEDPLHVRLEERLCLGALAEKILEKNKDSFQDTEEVLTVFVKAALTGKALPLARVIEKTFGKDSFKKLGEGKIEEILGLSDAGSRLGLNETN